MVEAWQKCQASFNKNIRDGAFVYGNYVDDLLPGAVIDQLETLRVEYSWTGAYH